VTTGVGGFGGFSTTGTTVSTSGVGGFGGRAGTGGFGGRGGRTGAGGAFVFDAGVSNPLLGILPGIRQTVQCNACVDLRCDGTSACSSDPSCLMSTSCYFAACAPLPQQQQLPCALKCFNGNVPVLMAAFEAVSCVYGACGPICTRGAEP
jgi:hypothetical protein